LLPSPRQATVLSIGDGDTIGVRQGGQAITVRLACNREGCAFAQA
jgi:endonuclease YncB( thermonuclease family)